MGGLWVDYKLMSNVPGLFVIGEANFSDHGANRLGASALMQGLADGYFVLPYTIGDYLAPMMGKKVKTDAPEFAAAENGRSRTDRPASRRERQALGRVVLERARQDHVGEGRHGARSRRPDRGAAGRSRALREQFWRDVKLVGGNDEPNQALEKAIRVADYFELAELMCVDGLNREESAGGHFRTEYQTPEGEAQRNDDEYAFVSAWEFKGVGADPALHKENLVFENVKLSTRSYK